MRYLNILIISILVAGIYSCDRDELFEREQYKKQFALLSDDGYNVFAEEHDLNEAETAGYVAAACGGSLLTDKDINITMIKDESLLAAYNNSNYAVDYEKYAHLLPEHMYDIDSYGITIPSGERTGRMKIRIRANGLSPDSAYFIPLRVNSFDAYELNPEKNTVMYRVFLKNYYATQKTATYYSFRGKRDGVNAMGTKQVFPVSGNKVRVVAGGVTYESKLALIRDACIVLEVDEDNNVTITPWKDIRVTQIDDDPDFPNIFMIENDGYKTYKTFLLRYDYVYRGQKYVMQEELRLEFKENQE
ncbi:MAG: DUF4361 domain-containing protein [Bacteroidales bacterium]|nr:DUF4361 domain-containing protein [Bacteroidales bacterium]